MCREALWRFVRHTFAMIKLAPELRHMATLHSGALHLVVECILEPHDDLDIALGLFCNGVPVLNEVSKTYDGILPPGFVWTDDYADEARDLVASLRPAVVDRRPRMWFDVEHRVQILLYPPAYDMAIHPNGVTLWDETWPELAEDMRQGNLQQNYSAELPAPAHVRPVEEYGRFLLQVCVCPSAMGYARRGYITLELHVKEEELLAFFDSIRAERKSFIERHRVDPRLG